MKIAFGCDHGGINLKPVLMKYLQSENIEVIDFGCYDGNSVDYVDYAEKVGDAVANGQCDLGILFCGTGIGMSIAANKIKGVRCAHCHDVFSARMTKLHNDANVLALGERVVGPGLMLDIVKAFVFTPFSNEERHVRRVDKIKAIENKNFR